MIDSFEFSQLTSLTVIVCCTFDVGGQFPDALFVHLGSPNVIVVGSVNLCWSLQTVAEFQGTFTRFVKIQIGIFPLSIWQFDTICFVQPSELNVFPINCERRFIFYRMTSGPVAKHLNFKKTGILVSNFQVPTPFNASSHQDGCRQCEGRIIRQLDSPFGIAKTKESFIGNTDNANDQQN